LGQPDLPPFPKPKTEYKRSQRSVREGVLHPVTQRGTDRQGVFFKASDRKVYLFLVEENAEAATWLSCRARSRPEARGHS